MSAFSFVYKNIILSTFGLKQFTVNNLHSFTQRKLQKCHENFNYHE